MQNQCIQSYSGKLNCFPHHVLTAVVSEELFHAVDWVFQDCLWLFSPVAFKLLNHSMNGP